MERSHSNNSRPCQNFQMAETSSSTAISLFNDDDVAGFIDHRVQPALRSSSGGWRSAAFIIVVEVAEIFAYYGISSNLITYLTGPLGQSTTFAFENVNAHMAIGISETLWVVVYVQDNLSWAVGFAIPCFTMFASLVTFIIGRSTYRFSIRRKEDRNPFLKIGRVIVRAVRRSSGSSSSIESGIVTSEEGKAYMLSNHSSEQFN
ncbi:Protein NRT1/ PTR FAMILY 5.10 [Linum perenne]